VVEAESVFGEHTYEGWLRSPLGLFFEAAGQEIYVADTDGRRIGIFDRRGAPLGDVRLPGLDGRKDTVLAALQVDARGWLYVAEHKLCEIYVYDEARKLVARFGSIGYDRAQFQAIAALAVDGDELYVLDQVATAVQVFDRRGRFLRGFGEHAMGPESFSLPSGLAVAPGGDLFVADALRHEVKVFAPDGRFLGRFGGRGAGLGELGYPAQLAFDGDALLVLEKANGRVQRFHVGAPAPLP
jgi:sugar lactone lactonase YvrE